MLDNVTPILDAKGRVIGGTAASIDITERKQAEAALEESRSELEKALQENEQARAGPALSCADHFLRQPRSRHTGPNLRKRFLARRSSAWPLSFPPRCRHGESQRVKSLSAVRECVRKWSPSRIRPHGLPAFE